LRIPGKAGYKGCMPTWEIRRTITTLTYVQASSEAEVRTLIRNELLPVEDLLMRCDTMFPASKWTIQPVDPTDGGATHFDDESLSDEDESLISLPFDNT